MPDTIVPKGTPTNSMNSSNSSNSMNSMNSIGALRPWKKK